MKVIEYVSLYLKLKDLFNHYTNVILRFSFKKRVMMTTELNPNDYSQKVVRNVHQKHKKPWYYRLGPLGLLFFAVLKSAKFLFAILKFGKFGSLLSMIVAVWAYSLYFGWPFAVGFVLLIFVHEMGHAIALRREGITAGAPVFIPFMGAFISMKGLPRNAWVEAKVGIAGPLLGTIGALMVLLLALDYQSPLLFALAQTGFLINLFNMLPVSPMDGGRVLGAVSRWFLLLGLVVGGVAFFYIGQPLLLLMLVLGVMQVWQVFKRPIPGYFQLSSSQRLTMGLSYLALLVFLFESYRFSSQFLVGLNMEEHAVIYGSSFLVGFMPPFLQAFLKSS